MRRNLAVAHTRSPWHAPLGPVSTALLGPTGWTPSTSSTSSAPPFWVSLAIVFIECGLLFPILPGDSLLFAIGLFIATGKLRDQPRGSPLILLFVAAFLGNVVGYEIGRASVRRSTDHDGRIIKRKYFDQTHDFFEKHGNKALVIGRFVPIVRTFITVVAGSAGWTGAGSSSGRAVGAALWACSHHPARLLPRPAFPVLQDKLEVAIVLVVLGVADPGGRRVVAAPP